MRQHPKTQFRYFVPVFLLLIPTAVTVLPIPSLLFTSDTTQPIWHILPYVAGIAFTFFTLRMNRIAEAHMGLTLCASLTVLSVFSDPEVTAAIAITVPAALSAILLLNPLNPLSSRSAFALGATVLATAIPIAIALLPWMKFPAFATKELFGASQLWVIPDISLLFFLILIAVAASKAEQIHFYFHYTVLISLAALFFAFESDPGIRIGNQPWVRSVTWSSLFAILLTGTYRLYWQRVYIDDLTGILNRRALDERMRGLTKNYAIAMVDIDHFKDFNDTYGHAEGDNVLRWVAKLLKDTMGDQAFRYGGEEFAVIFTGENGAEAAKRMDTIREELSKKSFYLRKPGIPREGDKKDRGKNTDGLKAVTVTFSGGVSSPTGKKDLPEHVILRADQALYSAKKQGRNRVVEHQDR